MDNEQFVMGQAMKTKAESVWEVVTSKLARLYVTRWKGLDVSCVEGGLKKAM